MFDQLRFLARLAANPSQVGAVAPSGRPLARAIAARTDPGHPGNVLELGPGTGAVTRKLIARGYAQDRITVVERDPSFAATIGRRWPRLRVLRANALQIATLLPNEHFAYIVSGLPMLNFPDWVRERLIADALAMLSPGGAFIQFSYGIGPPAEPPGIHVERAAHVWRNLPPAKVWVYRA
jgi:phosphatidylethanolamine/phosphatidyl-N-methylethanolamine N-methyltransferase